MDVRLSENSPILFREGNKCFSNNGSIIYGFALNLKEIYSNSESDFDAIHDMWYSALRDLPVGSIVCKSDFYLSKKFDSSSMPGKTFFQKETQKHFNGRSFTAHFPFIFFVFSERGKVINNGYKNPFKRPVYTKEFLQDYEENNNFENLVERSVDFINNARFFKLEPVTPEVFDFLEFSYFNGFYDDRFTEIETESMHVGNRRIGVLAVTQPKQLGETITNCHYDPHMSKNDYIYFAGFADNLGLKQNFDHVYNQIIFIKDHQNARNKLETQKNLLYGARRFKSEYEDDSKELGEFLKEVSADKKILLFGSHFNVVFFANTDSEFVAYEQRLANEFRSMGILPYAPIGENKKNLFLNSFFANVANIDQGNIIEPIDLQQSLCFFTNVTNYKSDEKGIYFNERVFNIPVKKDVWDENKKRIKARNFFFVAPTGEGKSVLANHVFRQFYEDDVRLIIIDLGNSYRKLSLFFDPKDVVYVTYQEGKGIGLNPFYHDGVEDISSTKINELATFTFKLWKRDRLPEEDEAVSLRKIIKLYYSSVSSNHSFPQFYKFIEQNKDNIMKVLDLNPKFFDVEDFLHITSEFVGNGIYSFLFSEEADESYRIEGKKFIVFELDEIKDNHLLLTIMLHMISEAVQKVVWRDRTTKGVIFFDEFAKMLTFPAVLSSAEYFYQAARKQQAAIGIVLQTPNQLPLNDSAAAIIDNTQVLYVLPNDKNYQALIDRLSLKKHDINQLGSINTNFSGKRRYSEFLLKIGSESNILRLELPPKVLTAFETEGKDYTAVMELYEKYGDIEKAIEQYSKFKS